MNNLSIEYKKPSICFVAHFAYGALAGIDTGHSGGIERQQSLMARWLAQRDYQVSMITWDEGQEDGIEIDGVKVYKMCRRDEGIKGLRFFWPKWSSLNSAMKRANADIYYYNCGDLGLGQVIIWTRRNNRKCVYSVASDPHCDVKLPEHSFRERILYRYGLKHADEIIVQNRNQKKMLEEGFNIKSTLIPMPCEAINSNMYGNQESLPQKNNNVIWIGRISKEKRFGWLLDIAEKCPEITFYVVGGSNNNSEYALMLLERAKSISNIKLEGRIPHKEIGQYYRKSNVLCCTSAYEGFPNTFLEAWSCGIPVVSTFDPDGIIAKNNLGWAVSSVDESIRAIRESLSNSQKWKIASESCRNYYLKNHTLDSCMEQFTQIFHKLMVS